MLEHGGNLREASLRYGIPVKQWLDLSTGINPIGWPVPALPQACWRRLPEPCDGLIEAAGSYYGCKALLPVAGSQAAIQLLPMLRPRSRAGVLTPSYGEHARAWEQSGHAVTSMTADGIESRLDLLDVLVLVNPNNPTGETFDPATLLRWHGRLATRGGWLVVDEAFMDATPEFSIAGYAGIPGLVVLRSVGKFFGLAGARTGFVLAWAELLRKLEDRLGPWPVAGPARLVARLALEDSQWQKTGRERLIRAGERLACLLARHHLSPHGGTALFQWARTPHAAAIHHQLAMRGILTRHFAEPSSLRFGLPGKEAEWQRLETALQNIIEETIPPCPSKP
ncbi:MAG: threonine-phosphate decarboxylase CobD [Pseudomonadota bacterium]